MTPTESPQEHLRNALMLLDAEPDIAAARARIWRAVEQLEAQDAEIGRMLSTEAQRLGGI